MKHVEARIHVPMMAIIITCGMAVLSWAGSTSMSVPVVPGAAALADGTTQLIGLSLATMAGDITPSQAAACVWYNGARKSMRLQTSSGIGSVGVLFDPPVVDSTTLANPLAATAFSSKVTIPANSLVAGQVLRVRSWGKYTTGITVTPTIGLGLNVGASAMASTGLISTLTTLTDKAWAEDASLIVRTAGAGGTMTGLVRGELGGLLGVALPVSQVGRSGSIAVDTTGALDIVPTALFGVTNASNAITCEGLLVERQN